MLELRGGTGRVRALAFAPDGRALASVSGQAVNVRVWDLEHGGMRHRLRGHVGKVTALAAAGRAPVLATADAIGFLRVWDFDSGREVSQFQRNTPYGSAGIYRLCLSPDGQTLAGELDYSRIILWTPTGQQLQTLTPQLGGLRCIAFAPDGETLAAGGTAEKVLLWDVAGKQRIALLEERGEVNGVAWSGDGRLLALSVGWTAAIWDVADRKRLIELKGHRGRVWTAAFTPDGRTVVTASNDGRVKTWDLATGRERASFDWGMGRVSAVAVSADGTRAAAGGEGPIVVWDVE